MDIVLYYSNVFIVAEAQLNLIEVTVLKTGPYS